MAQKHKISIPIIVEGKYDKNTLSQLFDATVITLGGFSVFNSKEKQALIRRISENGIILLTDPDGGGKQIRSFINGILPKDKIFNVYIPRIAGKERRKDKRSKEGVLGVEGMDRETLENILSPFFDNGERVEKNMHKDRGLITKVDFFLDRLTGCENATARRAALASAFRLPEDMTANALLEALNIVTDREGYSEAIKALDYVD
jgi:ribonuclease M5